MRKFVILIFMILMCFLFLMPGISFSGIVSGPDQMIGQDIITPMADCKAGVVNHFLEATELTLAVVMVSANYLNSKNYRHNALNSLEGGTILKCPTLADLTIKY